MAMLNEGAGTDNQDQARQKHGSDGHGRHPPQPPADRLLLPPLSVLIAALCLPGEVYESTEKIMAREDADLKSDVVATFPQGTSLTVLEHGPANLEKRVKVREVSTNREGWVSAIINKDGRSLLPLQHVSSADVRSDLQVARSEELREAAALATARAEAVAATKEVEINRAELVAASAAPSRYMEEIGTLRRAEAVVNEAAREEAELRIRALQSAEAQAEEGAGVESDAAAWRDSDEELRRVRQELVEQGLAMRRCQEAQESAERRAAALQGAAADVGQREAERQSASMQQDEELRRVRQELVEQGLAMRRCQEAQESAERRAVALQGAAAQVEQREAERQSASVREAEEIRSLREELDQLRMAQRTAAQSVAVPAPAQVVERELAEARRLRRQAEFAADEAAETFRVTQGHQQRVVELQRQAEMERVELADEVESASTARHAAARERRFAEAESAEARHAAAEAWDAFEAVSASKRAAERAGATSSELLQLLQADRAFEESAGAAAAAVRESEHSAQRFREEEHVCRELRFECERLRRELRDLSRLSRWAPCLQPGG